MSIGTVLRLGLADHGRVVSAQEFADADYDEPYTYERENGRLVVMPPEGGDSVLATNPWRNRLIIFQFQNPGIIQEVVTQNWVRPDHDTDRIGDIGVFLANRPFDLPDGAPDLMFEIVSAGKKNKKRDYVTKRAEYEALGVKEYVIVDRFDRRVTVLTLGPEGYVERALTEADTYESPLLPGLAIAVGVAFGG